MIPTMRKIMSPNPIYSPTPAPERAVNQTVAVLIRRKLFIPIRTIGLGLRSVLRATVPETSIHKHRELEFWKNEIRFAEHRVIASPAGDTVAPQQFCQHNFRLFVPAPPNPAHHLRSFPLCEDVRH